MHMSPQYTLHILAPLKHLKVSPLLHHSTGKNILRSCIMKKPLYVCFFLLRLHIQIARKRHKVITTFRSPLGQTRPPAHLKHIALMPLSQIRRVLDIQDTEGEGTTWHTASHQVHSCIFQFCVLNQHPGEGGEVCLCIKCDTSLQSWPGYTVRKF